MLINSLSLKNFKCFEEVDVKFAPITLLTGANSSGKSSLINAILAVLQTERFPFYLSPNGKYVNMGSFEEMVKGNEENNTIEISLEGLFKAKYNKDSLGKIFTNWQIDHKNGLPKLSNINVDMLPVNIKVFFEENTLKSILEFESTYASFMNKESLNHFLGKTHFKPFRYTKSKLHLKTKKKISFDDFMNSFNESSTDFSKNFILHSLIEILSERIKSIDDDFNYIGSFRQPPARTYYQKSRSETKVLSDGEGYIDQIIRWEEANYTKYTEFINIINELDLADVILSNQLKGGRFELKIKAKNSSIMASLTDVGFGISQFLPIIIADLQLSDLSCLTISQPEIHLHPKVQASFANYLTNQVRRTQKQYVIETHSEYLLNRIRLLLVKGELNPEDVKVYYFENDGIKSVVHDVEFTTDGQIKGAPVGFFETYMLDVMDIALNAVE